MLPSDAQHAKAIASLVDHFGWKMCNVLFDDTSFGSQAGYALVRELTALPGFTVQSSQVGPPKACLSSSSSYSSLFALN